MKPDKEVHQVDDICDVVEDHPQVVGHVPEHGAGDHEEDVVQDSNGYHLQHCIQVLYIMAMKSTQVTESHL